MADLSFPQVLLIGGVATIGFIFLSYWFSGVMARRNWSWQVRKLKKRPAKAKPVKTPKQPRSKGRSAKTSGRRRAKNESTTVAKE